MLQGGDAALSTFQHLASTWHLSCQLMGEVTQHDAGSIAAGLRGSCGLVHETPREIWQARPTVFSGHSEVGGGREYGWPSAQLIHVSNKTFQNISSQQLKVVVEFDKLWQWLCLHP